MRLRARYRLAGLAWAALLGPAVALGVFAAGAGVAWLYVFGDDPWPDGALGAVGVIAAAAGLLAGALCFIVASRYGARREAAAPDRARERRRTVVLIAAPLVLLLLAGAGVAHRSGRLATEANEDAEREADHARLLAARHTVAGIDLQESDGAFRATLRLAGARPGGYALRWQVVGTTFGAPLIAGERRLELEAGDSRAIVEFTLAELAARYREIVIGGRGGVLVEEPFRLEAVLEPRLSPQELADLPPGERYRLEHGESPLASRASAGFPVRFTIQRNGEVVF